MNGVQQVHPQAAHTCGPGRLFVSQSVSQPVSQSVSESISQSVTVRRRGWQVHSHAAEVGQGAPGRWQSTAEVVVAQAPAIRMVCRAFC
jgi:hypothetical protein